MPADNGSETRDNCCVPAGVRSVRHTLPIQQRRGRDEQNDVDSSPRTQT